MAGGWRAFALAVVVLGVAAPSASADGPWNAGPAQFGVSSPQALRVTMSDGVSLAVDVYVPTDPATGQPAAGPFPVVVSETPYDRRSPVTTSSAGDGLGGNGYYPYLVQRGYIDVVADVRGTGSSDGDFQLFGSREIQDGVELVDWAAKLPHSTGRVGMAGVSYLGLNQLYTAATIGPDSPLGAIVPAAAGNDLFRDIAFGGGIPNAGFTAAWTGLRASMTVSRPDDPAAGSPAAVAARMASRALHLAQFDADLYAEVEQGGPRAFENDFWTSRAPSSFVDRIVANGVPAMMVSGWYDVYQRGEPINLASLQNAWAARNGVPGGALGGPMLPGQRTTPRYQLVMGPWFHDATGTGERIQQLQLAWFDHWLKGRDTGIETGGPLHAYELGPGRWIDAAAWPPPQARGRTFWLDGGRSGTAASLNDGTLIDSRPRSTGTDMLPFTDARGPCDRQADQWSTGLGNLAVAMAGLPATPCASDDRSTQAGALTYTTAPLAKPLTIAGPIGATLWASSTTADAEWVATLEDVAPDGATHQLTTGALLGSLRAVDRRQSWTVGGRLVLPQHPYTAESAKPLTPGAPTRFDVEVYPTVAQLAAGDRLRVTITPGGTALQPSAAQLQKLAGGVYSVSRGGPRASSIALLAAPPSAFATSPVDWGPCHGGC
jgi:uncharacterized protein